MQLVLGACQGRVEGSCSLNLMSEEKDLLPQRQKQVLAEAGGTGLDECSGCIRRPEYRTPIWSAFRVTSTLCGS